MNPEVVSIQLGLPRCIDDGPESEQWTSGIFKFPIDHAVSASATGLEGDGQADLRVHGGPDKAVLVYSLDHFPDWLEECNFDMLPPGAFGENLSVTELTEESVCIGDEWALGTVVFQVSQPRQPCWKLGRRWNMPDLPKRVVASGRSGWYLRVLQPGVIEPGPMQLSRRVHPDWTIRRANDVFYNKSEMPELKTELAALPELSAAWKNQL